MKVTLETKFIWDYNLIMEQSYIPYNAEQIANYFIEKANSMGIRDLSPMKLQKLVYFAHGCCLALLDRPLLNEPIEAWRYGPVINSLYQEFKKFGNSHLTKKAQIADEDGKLIDFPSPTDQNIVALLDKILESYGRYTAFQLSNATHYDGTPWDITWNSKLSDIDYSSSGNRIINNSKIKFHFDRLAE